MPATTYAYTIRQPGCSAWARTDCLSRAGLLLDEALDRGLTHPRAVVVDAHGQDVTDEAASARQDERDGLADCACAECAEGQ